MRVLLELSDRIGEEARDACSYANLAVRMRDAGLSASAQSVFDIAQQELAHADRVSSLASSMMTAKRQAGDVPDGMEQIWDCLHEGHVRDMARARESLSVYTGR